MKQNTEHELLSQMGRFLEKQDMLNMLTENANLHGYGYSEIHTIKAIKELAEPNVTEIARQLNMTRGAISKITKKLLKQGLIESFQSPDNRQKIFFRVTEAGMPLYEEHEKRHAMWEQRDMDFLGRFKETELKEFLSFMNSYNAYLQQQIDALTEKTK
jgi:DNA-binding MarR family transcriptional regulator